MAATGEGKNNGNDNSTNKDMQDKECLVFFRPKDDWKGEFGFDWIRMGESFEKEYIDDEGTESDTSPSNIGKYVGPAQSATVIYEKKSNKFTIDAIPFDTSNFVKDVEMSKFAIKYIIDRGWKFPVLEENGGLYFFDYGLNEDYHKTVEFEYVFTEVKEKKAKKEKPTKKKKELDMGDLGKITMEVEDENPTLELLDVEVPSKQYVYSYKIEYEKGEVKEVKIYDEKYDSITFKKNDRKKATDKKVMEKWHTNNELVKRIWNNYNMDEESLAKDTKHIRSVRVDCGSYKKLEIEREDGPITCTDIYEYECCKLIKFTHIKGEWDEKTEQIVPKKYQYHGAYDIVQGINKKNIKNDSRCLIDPYLTVRTLSKNSQNVKITATFSPAIPQRFKLIKGQGVNKYGETCETITQAEGDVVVMKSGGSKGFVKSKEPVILKPFTDDGFLHTYWDDMYVDGKKIVAKNHLKNDPPTLDWYYFPTLGLTNGQKNKKLKRGVYDQAELKLKMMGSFDEIELSSSNKNLELSRKKIKSASDDDLTVKLTGACKPDEYITAKSKGVEVGHLKVKVMSHLEFNICYITVNCFKKTANLKIDAADSILPGNRRWKVDSDSHHKEIMAQGGCILNEIGENDNLSVNVLEEDRSRGPLEDVSDDPSNCSRYLVWDEADGENVFLLDAVSAGGKSIAQFLDERFLGECPEYKGCVRVYILNKYLETYENFMKENYQDKYYINGLVMPDKKNVILLFKKSIEANGDFSSETLAHMLGCMFGLYHSFDNRSQFTFKYMTTTNAMDYGKRLHSLVPYQWDTINSNLKKVYDDLKDEANSKKQKGAGR